MAYVNPVQHGSFETYDQGIDVRGQVGDSVLAIGDGIVMFVSQSAGGFGKAVYYKLTSGPGAGRIIYIGHAEPNVVQGQKVHAGDPLARLLQHPLGNAATPGHTEIGFAHCWGGSTVQGCAPISTDLGHGLSKAGSLFAGWLASVGISNVSEYGPGNRAVAGAPAPSPPPPSSGSTGGVGSTVAGVICKAECCWQPIDIPFVGHELCAFSPLCRTCKAAAAVSGAGSGLGNPLGVVGDVGTLLGNLVSASFWLRIGEVLAGALVALAGLAIIMKHIGLSPPAVPVPVP